MSYNQYPPAFPPPSSNPNSNKGFPLAVISLVILVVAFYSFFNALAVVSDALIMTSMVITFLSPVFSIIDIYRKRYLTFSIVMLVVSLIPAAFVALLWIAGAVMMSSFT